MVLAPARAAAAAEHEAAAAGGGGGSGGGGSDGGGASVRLKPARITAVLTLSNGHRIELDGRAANIAALVGVYAKLINAMAVGRFQADFAHDKTSAHVQESLPRLDLDRPETYATLLQQN